VVEMTHYSPFPQYFLPPFKPCDDAGDDKQQIRKSIEVSERIVIDAFAMVHAFAMIHAFATRQGDDAAFGAAAYGAGDVAGRCGGAAAGQDKLLERGQRGVEGVELRLQTLRGVSGDGAMAGYAQFAAEVEEVMLDGNEAGADVVW